MVPNFENYAFKKKERSHSGRTHKKKITGETTGKNQRPKKLKTLKERILEYVCVPY